MWTALREQEPDFLPRIWGILGLDPSAKLRVATKGLGPILTASAEAVGYDLYLSKPDLALVPTPPTTG